MADWKDWPEVKGALLVDGFDEAVVGVSVDPPHRVIYSTVKIEEILVSRDGMEPDGASEYAWFNIYTAHVGPRTPLFSTLVTEV